jgi:hypothetical protein
MIFNSMVTIPFIYSRFLCALSAFSYKKTMNTNSGRFCSVRE